MEKIINSIEELKTHYFNEEQRALNNDNHYYSPKELSSSMLSEEVKADREFVKNMMEYHPSNFIHASYEIRSDKDFILNSINTASAVALVRYMNQEFINDPDIMGKAIKAYPSTIIHIGEELGVNKQFLQKNVTKNATKYIDDIKNRQTILSNKDFQDVMINKNVLSIAHFPDRSDYRDIVTSIIKEDPLKAIKNVFIHKDPEFATYVLENLDIENKKSLKILKEHSFRDSLTNDLSVVIDKINEIRVAKNTNELNREALGEWTMANYDEVRKCLDTDTLLHELEVPIKSAFYDNFYKLDRNEKNKLLYPPTETVKFGNTLREMKNDGIIINSESDVKKMLDSWELNKSLQIGLQPKQATKSKGFKL